MYYYYYYYYITDINITTSIFTIIIIVIINATARPWSMSLWNASVHVMGSKVTFENRRFYLRTPKLKNHTDVSRQLSLGTRERVGRFHT